MGASMGCRECKVGAPVGAGLTWTVPAGSEAMASAAIISGSVSGVVFVVLLLAALLYILRR